MSIADLQINFDAMSTEQFKAEFLGVWGDAGSKSGFIDPDKWKSCLLNLPKDKWPQKPKQFSIAFSAHLQPSSSRPSTVTAAWRDEKTGLAYIEVIESKPGVNWLIPFLQKLYAATRQPIIYDNGRGSTDDIGRQLAVLKVKTLPQNWIDVSNSAVLFTREVDNLRIRHFGQPALDGAVEVAKKRGTAKSSRWAFDGLNFGSDVTAVEAASMALRVFDKTPKKDTLPSKLLYS